MQDQNNFGGLIGEYANYENSNIVIVPVPFINKKFTYNSADKGPDAIIKASQNLELYDIETSTKVFEKIIHTSNPILESDPQGMIKKTAETIFNIISKEKFPVILGGEHTVSLGPIFEFSKKKEITVVQLDAHTDLREEFEGDKYFHGCVMNHARTKADLLQIGIRSMDDSEKAFVNKNKIFYAKDIVGRFDWINKAINKAKDDVYVTIDLDVFESSIMPSTSTPEPGGLGWYETINFLYTLSQKKNILGFDVVELSPIKGMIAPDFLAAKLIYTFLSSIFKFKACQD